LTPGFRRSVKGDCDRVRHTVFRPFENFWRNLAMAQINGKARELSGRSRFHRRRLTHDFSAGLFEDLAHLYGQVVKKLVQPRSLEVTILKLVLL
jgi:hypothetical protein